MNKSGTESRKDNFELLRDKHWKLFKRTDNPGGYPTLLPEVRDFMQRTREAGLHIWKPEERDFLQTILSFWGSFVYEHSEPREYPPTDLHPLDPEIANRVRREKTRKWAAAFVTVLMIVVAAVSIPRYFEKPTIEVTVDNLKDGDFVDASQQITGTYRGLSQGSKIYVVVEPSPDKWLPQSEPFEVKKSDGPWRTRFSFEKGNPGEAFKLLVVVVAPEDKATDQELSEASANGKAIAPRPDVKVEQSISVWRWPIVEIKYPKDGYEVDYTETVTGTFSGSFAGWIYGFVQPVKEDVIYLQPLAELDEEKGVWSITAARFGDEEKHRGEELTFFVGIAQTDSPDQELLYAPSKSITITILPPGVFKYEKEIIGVKRK